jgi:hypothetical protein
MGTQDCACGLGEEGENNYCTILNPEEEKEALSPLDYAYLTHI